MKILHVTSHLGGGLGTVLMDWMQRVVDANDHDHRMVCLDYANERAKNWTYQTGFPMVDNMGPYPRLWEHEIIDADIVLCHYYDHPMIAELFADPIPECRLVFWCHKNIPYSKEELSFPDLWVDTSPIQNHGKHIWSTGDMTRFFEIKPKPHEGFNIGTVISKKMGIAKTMEIFRKIKAAIPSSYITWIGDFVAIGRPNDPGNLLLCFPDFTLWGCQVEREFTLKETDPIYQRDNDIFAGKVNDIAPYLSKMDIFAYPLRPDHYGTCEQVLGEVMAAGVVPLVRDNLCEKTIVPPSFRFRDEKDYIEGIIFLYRHPLIRKSIKRSLIQHAKELYNIDTMISQWNETFESMMKEPKKERGVL